MEPRIKWPNDVIIDNKKICGILCEVQFYNEQSFVIVGIGLNINNPAKNFEYPLNQTSISLHEATGETHDIQNILQNLLDEESRLLKELSEGAFNKIRDEIVQCSLTIGQRVRLSLVGNLNPIVGKAVAISNSGSLILSLDDGSEIELLEGDIEHLR